MVKPQGRTAMTCEEAIALAERYMAEKGISSGPMRLAHYFTGAEFDVPQPPSWGVYFWDSEPVENPSDDMAETCLCVTVDDASGAASLVSWL
jgi:hypothetical protein